MDEVFKALADGSRRRLLDRLNERNGQTLRELCAGLDMARQSVSKHLAVLEAANLITTVRRGREKLHYLNAEPVNAIADRWIQRYDRARVHALADLKTALEQTAMADTEFVYTTYIDTTPERLWRALTDPAFTRRYWNTSFDTDWAAGSPMTWHIGDVVVKGPEQVVLEADPYRRLSYSWHDFTEDIGAAVGLDEPTRARVAAEPRSTVTFDIEPADTGVKLTVVHDGLAPGGVLRGLIGGGWPAVVARLKTLLESGDDYTARLVLRAPAERIHAAVTTLDGLRGWWTRDTTGGTAPGDELRFAFEGYGSTVVRVEEDAPDRVRWTSVGGDAHPEWNGTSIVFEIEDGLLRFTHAGLRPGLDCYDACRAGWDQFLRSLADYAETGTGAPFGAQRDAARP
ncbi:metalloregulator ArsR/SmtB family transcription factor [Actinomadura parmotrematis]|uniref:Metalloregulator ArsR/SmtB family transcription factor n=1 Tax=Actinomadura parmotrematis TaxID=2864039 RepID=A0ABS7G2M4_9ACTN|nr:metalloregulator ArsR/SmtB family transcription factor [Actinomadura parmotrematis]MBW8486964.1 metalloregulator ArsR/SmtB family transcription factor [Actinomadura parmotrematis]